MAAHPSSTTDTAPYPRRRAPPIRLRLLLLVAATVVPLVGFGAAVTILAELDGRAAAVEHTLYQARALLAAMEGTLEAQIAAASALTDVPALRQGDLATFQPRAEAFLRRHDSATRLAVVDSGNRILMLTGLATPGSDRLFRSNQEVTPRIVAARQPVVSNLFRSAQSGRLGFTVDVPVIRDDGTMPYYVSVTYDTAPLDRLLDRQQLPPGWVVSIIDGNGIILAQQPAAGRFVGEPSSPDYQPQDLPALEGSLNATSVTGVPVTAVYARSERFGWTVGIGVPRSTLAAPLRARLRQVALAGCVMLGLSLLGAWLVSRRIERSLRALAASVHTGPTGLREVDDLADALALRDAKLRAAYLAAPVGMGFLDPGLRFVEVNDRLAALDGMEAAAHRGQALATAFGPATEVFEPLLRRVLDTGEAVENLELRAAFQADAGQPRDLLVSMLPVRDPEGWIIGASVALTEITERKRAEERQMLLAREVDHRAKNALALAQSVVGLTEAPDLPSFAAIVRGRIAALARAHTLLARERWTGTALRDIAAEELAAVSPPEEARWTMEGPPVRLAAGSAQPVAMVLHELATNALKYGALSAPDGQIALHWEPAPQGGIALTWEEQGGPSLEGPPARLGFGSMLIAETMRRQIEGEVVKHWRRDGLVCRLHLPAEALQEQAPISQDAVAR